MSDHTDDISKHIRGYLIIGGTLIIGTVLTVLASYVDLGHHWNIVLALIIATVKASLNLVGVVQQIIYKDGAAYLMVNGLQVDLGDVLGVGEPGTFEA